MLHYSTITDTIVVHSYQNFPNSCKSFNLNRIDGFKSFIESLSGLYKEIRLENCEEQLYGLIRNWIWNYYNSVSQWTHYNYVNCYFCLILTNRPIRCNLLLEWLYDVTKLNFWLQFSQDYKGQQFAEKMFNGILILFGVRKFILTNFWSVSFNWSSIWGITF